jgi:hypothetical protein
MNFDIQTGNINLNVTGDNGVIVRKNGKKVKIISFDEEMKLAEEARKKQDYEKLKKVQEDQPKIESGDTIIAGKDTLVSVSSSYDKGKDKPDNEYSISRTVTLWPESEIKIGEVESWDRTDKTAKKRFYGEKFDSVELIKGTFNYRSDGNEDKLITPVADIIFKKDGGFGVFDLYNGNLYCNPLASENIKTSGEIEFINKNTKKSFTVKRSNGLCEIIVTSNAIYKKSFISMDKFFMDYNFSATMKPEMVVVSPTTVPAMGNYKDIGKIFEQSMSSMEMFKNLSSADLERLAKMGGQKISEEQLKQIKDLPEMTKMMEKEGIMEKMKEASAMVKGLSEGIGDEGAASMARLQKDAAPKMEAIRNQSFDMYKNAAKAPRNYAPLDPKNKVA